MNGLYMQLHIIRDNKPLWFHPKAYKELLSWLVRIRHGHDSSFQTKPYQTWTRLLGVSQIPQLWKLFCYHSFGCLFATSTWEVALIPQLWKISYHRNFGSSLLVQLCKCFRYRHFGMCFATATLKFFPHPNFGRFFATASLAVCFRNFGRCLASTTLEVCLIPQLWILPVDYFVAHQRLGHTFG